MQTPRRLSKNNSPGSLVVVGTGIKAISHLTVEAITYIQKSDVVLYSVNDPIIEAWIKENNSNAQSLDKLIKQKQLRKDIYTRLTTYILQIARKGKNLSVVFYGHPAVFADTALHAAQKAQEEGIFTLILPGISADNCLFADLMIDPASSGCQSYEATDLLIHKRHIDITSHLILWQVGIVGNLKNSLHLLPKNISVLQYYLSQYYPSKHIITVYEASLYPHIKPRIELFPLEEMSRIHFTPLSTLYLPPARKKEINLNLLNALSLTLSDLH